MSRVLLARSCTLALRCRRELSEAGTAAADAPGMEGRLCTSPRAFAAGVEGAGTRRGHEAPDDANRARGYAWLDTGRDAHEAAARERRHSGGERRLTAMTTFRHYDKLSIQSVTVL